MLTCRTNRELLLPYALPYVVWVLLLTFFYGWLSLAWIYGLRMVLVASLLWRFRSCYVSIFSGFSRPTSVLSGILGGIAGCFLWVVLVTPFVTREAVPWDLLSFSLRALSATLLVPIFEELLMRGYLFGLASQWDRFRREKKESPLMFALDHATINDAGVPRWSVPGVLVSTVFFAMGHAVHEWPAALAYGGLMAFLLIRTGGLLSCVVAHGITNVTLALYVWFTGQWGLW